MFDTLVSLLNDVPDATRFLLMDLLPALFDTLRDVATEHGCTLFEDGSIGCR